MDSNVRELVTEYVTTVGRREFDRLEAMVHPEVTFDGYVKAPTKGIAAFIQGFRNLGPILERNDIKQIVVDGGDAFVLYDFVTDTAVGPVLCGELIHIENGKISSVTLLFDWRRWPEVLQELQRRMMASPR